jgi:Methyltransferase domain
VTLTGSGRAFADLFRWGSRWSTQNRVNGSASAHVSPEDDARLPTKAFRKFLSSLSHRPGPTLLDLGPVVGANVEFFGEALGCKIFVEDLYADIDRFARGDRFEELSDHLGKRFTQGDASIDGILCWDVFDYLDRKSAPALARQLTRLLAPGGSLLGFFATVENPQQYFTRYMVVDDSSLRHRVYPSARGRENLIPNRDINRMFEGLTVSESFLLLTKTREMLFRKPAQPAEAPAAVHGTVNGATNGTVSKAAKGSLNGASHGALNGAANGKAHSAVNGASPTPTGATRTKKKK